MRQNTPAKTVTPKNRNRLRKDAYNLRRRLRLPPHEKVDILQVLELILPVVDPEFHLIPVKDTELLGCYAVTKPLEHSIYVKESVYEAAVRDSGWARMILAHELGHYYCHDVSAITYASLAPNERLNPDYDPERQADIFAAEFLAPSGDLRGMTPYQVQMKYGISALAAKNQLRQATNIQRRQERKKEKRSSQKA